MRLIVSHRTGEGADDMRRLVVAKRTLLIKFLAGSLVWYSGINAIAASPALSGRSSDEMTVEEAYEASAQKLKAFLSTISFRERAELRRVTWQGHSSLPPHQRQNYETWHRLMEERDQFEKAVPLKKDLLALFPEAERGKTRLRSEADQIARLLVQTLAEYRKKWTMIRPALLHNFFVNIGVKEKGFCWHWVELFQGKLTPLGIKEFTFHWGVAYEGDVRENNALIITRTGGPFDEGLAVDGWRRSGRPFWVVVKDDKFPWVERKD